MSNAIAHAVAKKLTICGRAYLREDRVTTAINRWIGDLFDPLHRRKMVDTLFEADDTVDWHAERQGSVAGPCRGGRDGDGPAAEGIGCGVGSG
jgi:hypothetical protein